VVPGSKYNVVGEKYPVLFRINRKIIYIKPVFDSKTVFSFLHYLKINNHLFTNVYTKYIRKFLNMI